MNNKHLIIEKIIKSNEDQCPKFCYENPLLDRNVAISLSKNFMKILNISQSSQFQLNSVLNNLRTTTLEAIRNMCRIVPSDHIQVDHTITDYIAESYIHNLTNHSEANQSEDVKGKLDAFLLKRMKSQNIRSCSYSTANPEVIQALVNLDQNGSNIELLTKDVIHWNTENEKNMAALKDLWDHNQDLCSPEMLDNIAIKMKAEIEKLLLDVTLRILTDKNLNIENVFKTEKDLLGLVKSCTHSQQCYEMCSTIINYLFILTNYPIQMQKFIVVFVNEVKALCPHITFSVLYPYHLSYIVVLLDMDLASLPPMLKEEYVNSTLEHLKQVHERCEGDLILLLSHFPQWFDIYFKI